MKTVLSSGLAVPSIAVISFAESENVDVVVTVDAIIGPVVAEGWLWG